MTIAPAAFGTVVPAVRLEPLYSVATAVTQQVRAVPRPPKGGYGLWFSGFCGSTGTTCQDTNGKCKGFVRNGSLAARPIITCNCDCHQEALAVTG